MDELWVPPQVCASELANGDDGGQETLHARYSSSSHADEQVLTLTNCVQVSARWVAQWCILKILPTAKAVGVNLAGKVLIAIVSHQKCTDDQRSPEVACVGM